MAKRSSDPRVVYPEVKVQVRDLVRVVGIVASFAGGWGSIALVGHSSRSLLDLYTKLAG